MSDGIDPPFFQEDDGTKLGWFSSIFRFIQRRTKVAVIAFADSPYSVPSDVSWVRANATDGAIVVNYPLSLSWGGREIGVMKTDASGNAVTPTRMGSDVFNGATTQTLGSQYSRMVAKADGTTNWDLMVKQ